jgi:pimeloyl-ACP methyl ester carboxylesterase
MIEATMTYDPMPALGSFHGPTWVIVTPANDQPFDLQHLVPTIVTTVVTGTSHWIQMDKPRVVNGILDGFLATIR